MITDANGPIKFAAISETTAASNEIVAAVTGKRIRILGIVLSAADAVTATIEDEDGNDLIGPLDITADAPIVLPVSGIGYQQTPATKALHLLLGGAVAVGGCITYQEIN